MSVFTDRTHFLLLPAVRSGTLRRSVWGKISIKARLDSRSLKSWFSGMSWPGKASGYDNKFDFTVHQDRVEKAVPLKRKKPTLYFINNMSDTFHEDADEQSIDRIMGIVKQAHWHNFYFLTKRSRRMRDYFDKNIAPDNLWLGVTVENKKHGYPRLEDLQKTKCKNRHICCEPLLEDIGDIDLKKIRFVVAGGESGGNARKAELNWVESLHRQCLDQNTHFYWKQWGSYDQDGVFRGKAKTGYLVNGEALQSFPEDLMPE